MTDTDSARPPRPRQVTLGSGLALVSCVLLVLTMLDSMPRMRSVETRDSVSEALTSPPGNGLGIDVDTVLGLLRVAVLVTGGLAAAGVVLAIFTFQRHRGARVGLTVIAVLLLLIATFVSGLLPLVALIGASMLWGREARDWFAGRESRPDPHAVGAAPAQRTVPQAFQQPSQQPGQQPVWTPGPFADGRPRRPWQVIVATCLTWGFTALTMLFLSLMLLLLLADQAQLLQALQDNPQIAAAGYSDRNLLAAMWVIVAVGIFWCLSATALAVLAFRRVNLGRIGLVVSSVLTGVLGAVTLVGLLHALAALAAIVLLFTRDANRWYDGTQAPQHQPPAPPSSPPSVW